MNSVIIRLQNLPMSANASNIRRFFTGLSIPEGGVHIVGGDKGDAFIAFATDEDARRAMLLDQQSINNTKIRLFLSSKTEMQAVIETARSSVMMANQQLGSLTHLSRPPSQYGSSHIVAAPPQPYPQTSTIESDSNKSLYNATSYKGPYSGPSTMPADMPPYSYGHGGSSSSWNNDRNGSQGEFAGYGVEKPPKSGRRDGGEASVAGKYDDFNIRYDDRNPPPSYPPEFSYYGGGNGYADAKSRDPSTQPHNYTNDRGPSDVERDFSVRPPWLNDLGRSQFMKRSSSSDAPNEPVPLKRTRTDEIYPSSRDSPCLDFVVKISMRPADVTVKGIFDLLRGVNIVPKFGIRVEEDANKRFTGNIYCLLTSPESHARALTYHGKLYNGYEVEVLSSTAEDFFKVTDSNFLNRCPPTVQSRVPPRGTTKPLFYSDACIEMSEIPSDVTEESIVDFLGVPGLTVNDVRISQIGVPPSTVALVRLPSPEVLNILLDAPSRRFNGSQPRDLKLVAISALQFKYAPPRSPKYGYKSQSDVGEFKPSIKKPDAPVKTCCFIYGFSRSITIFDLTQIFPNVFIPGDSIHLLPNGRSAVIDFVNEESCRNALRDFSAVEEDLKKTHRNLAMRAITKAEYEQKLEESQEEPATRASKPAMREDEDGGYSSAANRDYKSMSSHSPRFRPSSFAVHPQRPAFGPRGMGPRPPYPPPGPQFRRPGPLNVTNVFINNLPPNCPPSVLLDLFHRFRPLPGSLRFRRDSRGAPTGEAMISFGSFTDADRAAREINSTRLFNKSIAVHVQQQQ